MILDKGQLLETEQMLRDTGEQWPVIIPEEEIRQAAPGTKVSYPYVTGTSVIGIKFKDGILMAADMGGSYGSTLRYKSVERLKSVGKHSLLGASGEINDFQEILCNLDKLILYDNMWDDGNSLGPKEVNMIGVHFEDDHVATGFGQCIGVKTSLLSQSITEGLPWQDLLSYFVSLFR
ncbi:unnamed protein product [Camellia sinensis]